MFEKIFRAFFLISIIFCGTSDNDALSNQDPIFDDNLESLEVNLTTTTTTKQDNDVIYDSSELSQFIDKEVKLTFDKFFEIKIKDASVISDQRYHEAAGFELDECIEIFQDDFINEGWSDEYGVETTEEWCRRTIYLETKKEFQYPVVKEEISINCKSEFNSYMESFIETYIREETFERTWNNDFGFFGVTEVFGVGVENNTVEYLSFLFDVFPAGAGAYTFHDWFEINYNFTTCTPINFEDIIQIPEDYKTIFPQLENYTFEIKEATLIAHIFDLEICGENNLFCEPFLYREGNEYYPYSLDFLFNEKGLIVNIGNYFVHRIYNYRFLQWQEIESVTSEYVLDTVYYP